MEIIAQTIGDAWEASIRALLDPSLPIGYTQRGVRARELIALTLTVSSPLADPIRSPKYIFGAEFAEGYCNNILREAGNQPSIGRRISNSNASGTHGIDQFREVGDLLRVSPDSRRAVISLWDPRSDISSIHPPCLCTLQFLRRANRLDFVSYFRSNDAWMAALPDMLAVTLMAEQVSNAVGIPLGSYHHVAASYHIYEPDIVPALKAFE